MEFHAVLPNGHCLLWCNRNAGFLLTARSRTATRLDGGQTKSMVLCQHGQILLHIYSGRDSHQWARASSITLNDPPQSVGLLWTSDQLVAQTSTWQHTTLTTGRPPCPNTPFKFSNYSPKPCPLWDKVEKNSTAGQTTWQYNTAHALCILVTKATNTHSEHIILIPFPRQQRLWESASMLRYMHIACLVIT
jgi:hypothetical protein